MRLVRVALGLAAAVLVLAPTVSAPDPQPEGDSAEVYRSAVHYWQSYSAAPQGGVHEWVDSDAQYEISERFSSDVRTGFVFANGSQLVLQDRGPMEVGLLASSFRLGGDRVAPGATLETLDFVEGDRSFGYRSGLLLACELRSKDVCSSIAIPSGTFPYVWASHDGRVISITNRGIAFLFTPNGTWLPMFRHGDVYDLDSRNADDPAVLPRQFYSSIHFQGKTLLGEWPSGRLFEFDGNRVAPSSLTMQKFDDLALERLGYEAQSLAEYCGDLFVGYWPKGEVYRMDGKTGEWSLLTRFFTEATIDRFLVPSLITGPEEGFIPWSNRMLGDGTEYAFFGQRVTALVPWGDSLYASTSNLRGWTADLEIAWPPPVAQAQYGKVYEIHRPGCTTTYSKS